MKAGFPKFTRNSAGSALVITLVILVLITVVVVGYIASVMFETKAARASLNEQKAHSMATLGMHAAVAQLRYALGTGTNSWDNPFGNFMVNSGSFTSPAFFWSVSPGLLTRWEYPAVNYNGTATYANLPAADKIPLFSGTSVSISGSLGPTVNLNRQKSDGTYPIIGGTGSAPPVSVQWVNVLQNPTLSATNTNQIIGRFAYWIDDENSKININTADGTNKNNPAASLGAGSPTEVSLQVLVGNSGTMTVTTGSNIVQIARTTGFHSPREILRASEATTDLYTNNVFNVTTTSRSPDLNIFGEPKIPMLPGEGFNQAQFAQPYLLNCITMQPIREIYPTPSQLTTAKFTYANIATALSGTLPLSGTVPVITSGTLTWPTAFATEWSVANGYGSSVNVDNTVNSNFAGTIALLFSDYLAGMNPIGKSVYTWPAFPGSTATSFLQGASPGKYTKRQIDSIAAQVHDIGAKAISSDFYDVATSLRSVTCSAPTAANGWLSAQAVPGMGRCPKITRFLMKVTTQAGLFTSGTYNPPPEAVISTWVEWWLPAHYQGVDLWESYNASLDGIEVGLDIYGCLNRWDMGTPGKMLNLDNPGPTAPQVTPWTPGGGGPQANAGAIPNATNSPVSGTNNNYWCNNLMTNNKAIDFIGNPPEYPDPDQYQASFHPYLLSGSGTRLSGSFTVFWNAGTYLGSSPVSSGTFTSPAIYPVLCTGAITSATSKANEWAPGEIRCSGSPRTVVGYKMSGTSGATGAIPGNSLILGGGLSITSSMGNGNGETSPDLVPLESAQLQSIFPSGTVQGGTATMNGYLQGNLLAAQVQGVNSTMRTWRDRLIASVVPMRGTVTIPDDGSLTTNTLYIYSRVAADPLVNKFPGDWIMTTASTNPTTTLSGTALGFRMETSGMADAVIHSDPLPNVDGTQWYDPDSYWMPDIDSSIFGGESPAMPRCARFPSIGYLQYMRTGMIPDDETQAYAATGAYSNSVQHGTPFRLLNFAPSTSNTQVTTNSSSSSYPDWAMLDLVYEPSMLLAYGSPYAQYAGPVTITPYAFATASTGTNKSVTLNYQNTAAADNMFSYGTYGGATSGRINPNGSVIYTTDVTTPAKDTSGNTITRTVPLQGLLHGLYVNQNYVETSAGITRTGTNNYAWKNGMQVSDASLASAIATYIQTNGPLRMPGEICNIPAIAAMAPSSANGTANGNNGPYGTAVNNPTRNDLVRQIVGNITTQSNTFSVWVAGQTVQKISRNTNYGQFESGDNVLGEVRYHFVIERYLDPGADGVYGNANPTVSGTAAWGPDGIVGTLDDAVDPVYHPANPRYLYRVVSAEEIQ